ncbi:hypothetical protein HDV01_000047 [Terramyces sp. JEL0728]|nr:hypothetical protein HDV01_000047 [Terramyces sp. JEL0728]
MLKSSDTTKSLYTNLIKIKQLETISLKQLNYILSNNTEKANEAKHKILIFVFKQLNYSVKEIPGYLLKYNTSLDMLMNDLGSYQKILSLLLQNITKTRDTAPDDKLPNLKDNDADPVVARLFEEQPPAKHPSSNSLKEKRVSGDLDIKKILRANEIEPENKLVKLEEKRKSADRDLKRNSINRGFIQTKVKQEKEMVVFEKSNLQKRIEALEKENQSLSERNKSLENELRQKKEFYNELTSNEIHDYKQLKKRHFILLQSQIVQLKRQLSEYKQVLDKKETGVYNVQEQLFLLIKHIQKSDKIDVIKRLEAIAKHSVRSEQEIIEKEFDCHSEFIRQELQVVKMSDIVTQNINHLSLFHVSKLQGQLNDLYEDLALFKSNLEITNEFIEKRNQNIYETLEKRLLDTMNNLVSLGCLIPSCSTPQLPLKIENDDILKDLAITDQLKDKLEYRITNLTNRFNQILALNDKKTKSIETELEFHQNFYKKYNETVKDRISANQKEVEEYYAKLNAVLQPLAEMKVEMESLEWKEDVVFDFVTRFENVFNSVVDQLSNLKNI